MPSVQKADAEIVGLFIADVHLGLKAPLARSEKNWLEVQAKVWDQIKDLMTKCCFADLYIAGDLFDRWDSPAWLINWALENLPEKFYAIPGNHDLPNHLYTEAPKSAYWTLVEADRLKNLTPPGPWPVGHNLITPFPCGFEVKPPETIHGLALNIALVHDLIWTEKTGYEGAPDVKRYGKWMSRIKTYDVAFFGDNHKGFKIEKPGKCTTVNCGTLMRRKSNEMDLSPCVWKLHSNGKVSKHLLDVSKDQFSSLGKEISKIESSLQVDLSGFIEEMMEHRQKGESWEKTVLAWIKQHELPKEVQKIIIKAVGE